jgi:hypothetical protein
MAAAAAAAAAAVALIRLRVMTAVQKQATRVVRKQRAIRKEAAGW